MATPTKDQLLALCREVNEKRDNVLQQHPGIKGLLDKMQENASELGKQYSIYKMNYTYYWAQEQNQLRTPYAETVLDYMGTLIGFVAARALHILSDDGCQELVNNVHALEWDPDKVKPDDREKPKKLYDELQARLLALDNVKPKCYSPFTKMLPDVLKVVKHFNDTAERYHANEALNKYVPGNLWPNAQLIDLAREIAIRVEVNNDEVKQEDVTLEKCRKDPFYSAWNYWIEGIRSRTQIQST